MRETKALTDVFSVELVNANQYADGRSPQNPSEGWAEFRELAWMYVVHQKRIELIPSKGPQKNGQVGSGTVVDGENGGGWISLVQGPSLREKRVRQCDCA